jgi:hypothetical protein
MKYTLLLLILAIGCVSISSAEIVTTQCKKTIININTTNVNPITCSLCETAVKIIDYEVKTFNASIVVVEKIVADLCCLIGGEPVYKECIPILDKVQKIINWITKGLPPKKICQKLDMC